MASALPARPAALRAHSRGAAPAGVPRSQHVRVAALPRCSKRPRRSRSTLVNVSASGAHADSERAAHVAGAPQDGDARIKVMRQRDASSPAQLAAAVGATDTASQSASAGMTATPVVRAPCDDAELVVEQCVASTAAPLLLPAQQSLRVIITGGTRGVGRALAREFLWAHDRVLITGRSASSVNAAVALLREETGCARDAVVGMVADCSHAHDVKVLAASAPAALGGNVDVWIANAGCSGGFTPLAELQAEAVSEVVTTTLGGALLCAHAAQRLFAAQGTGGTLWLTDGAGGAGDATPMYAAYGACKAGIRQLTKSLVAEVNKAASPPPMAVGIVSPGMCLTDLLLQGATPRSKALFNALAEHPETAAAMLVPALRAAHVRAVSKRAARAPHLKVLTPARAAARMATMPLLRGRFFDAAGRATFAPEHERIAKLRAARQAAALKATGASPRASRRPGFALAYATSALALVAFLALAQ